LINDIIGAGNQLLLYAIYDLTPVFSTLGERN